MKENKTSFHKFCISRAIPLEMEIRFIEFFREFFTANFASEDDFIFNYLINEMSEKEILDFWNMYIRSLRYTLPTEVI